MFYTAVERIGSYIYYRGYDDNGQQFFKKDKFRPTIYLPKEGGSWKSLYGAPCEPYCPGDIYEAEQFIKRYNDVENFTYFGMTNWVYSFIAEKFRGEIKYDFNIIRKAFFDIETESENGFPDIDKANEAILSITITIDRHYTVFGYQDYYTDRPDVTFIRCRDEIDLIERFVAFWEDKSFDVISGWNSDGFDIPYLVNRITRLLGEDYARKFSPWRRIRAKKVTTYGQEKTMYEISGVNHVDLLDAYKKYSLKSHSSYKLGNIAIEEELPFGKIDYSEEGGALHLLYKTNYQKFIDYNIRDNEILVALDDKLRLLELIMDLTYYAKVNVVDTFRQTVMWDCIIHYTLLEKNVAIPSRKTSFVDRSIAGGYVKDVTPGMYEWMVTLDADSLYPSLMINYNISPETFVKRIDVDIDRLVEKMPIAEIDEAKRNNLVMTGNGSLYKKDFRGILPELMIKLFDERRHYKKEMLKTKDELNDIETELLKRGVSL